MVTEEQLEEIRSQYVGKILNRVTKAEIQELAQADLARTWVPLSMGTAEMHLCRLNIKVDAENVITGLWVGQEWSAKKNYSSSSPSLLGRS